jgi:putative flippase GtrA
LSFPSSLIQWIRHLIPEFTKFGMVGSVAFVIADGGSNLLRFQAGLDPLASVTIATIAGTAFAFVGNRYWTFRRRQRSGVSREGILFFVFNGIALLIQLAFIGFTTYALGLTGKLPYNIALIFGIGLGTLFRFWSYRKWVWADLAEVPVSPPPAKPHVPA